MFTSFLVHVSANNMVSSPRRYFPSSLLVFWEILFLSPSMENGPISTSFFTFHFRRGCVVRVGDDVPVVVLGFSEGFGWERMRGEDSPLETSVKL